MACPRLVVIGASAGGFETVRTILSCLGPDFPAAVCVVIHTAADGMMPTVLSRATTIPVQLGRDGEALETGHVYVPPPDCHLLLDENRIALSRGPRQHGFRPAVDPLFISAAGACRGNVIGIILSGALGDGTVGLAAVKRAGGIAVVQNPEEAAFPSMPLSALKSVEVDYILTSNEIGPALLELTRRAAPRSRRAVAIPPAAGLVASGNGRGKGKAAVKPGERELTPFVCPSCGGSLWEGGDEGVDEYVCHVGHHFSPEALQVLQTDQLDRALWTAVRALQEDAMLRERMAIHAKQHGLGRLATHWHAQAKAAKANVAALRHLVEAIVPPAMPDQLAVSAEQGDRAADAPPRGRKKTAKKTVRKSGRLGGGAKRHRH